MITIILGTRAQLIKMAPVILEIESRNWPLNLIYTGQHQETMEDLIADFDIKTNGHYLYRGKEITNILQMTKWFVYCLWRSLTKSKQYMLTRKTCENIIVVHGDTFSTLLGAVIGLIKRIKVAHVESGLRSFNILHPFPEELTRLLVFRLSDIAFCPGEWSFNNMRKFNTQRVNTLHNTLIDSLNHVVQSPSTAPRYDHLRPYCVCSIHRFENIFNKHRLETILEIILKITEQFQVIFVLHPSTQKKLLQFSLMATLNNNPNIETRPRMSYTKFITIIKDSEFVITDGGSNQEELSYIGKPTLLMRKTTERIEGLDSTVTVCNYDINIACDFIQNLPHSKKPNKLNLYNQPTPSSLIVDSLQFYK